MLQPNSPVEPRVRVAVLVALRRSIAGDEAATVPEAVRVQVVEQVLGPLLAFVPDMSSHGADAGADTDTALLDALVRCVAAAIQTLGDKSLHKLLPVQFRARAGDAGVL